MTKRSRRRNDSWVMLSETDGYTPLPGEQRLYTSPPRTSLLLQSLNRFPGRQPFSIQSNNGVIHLTNRRVIYLPVSPTPELQSFAAPILNLHDTHVDTPWFGPNTWTAIVQPVAGGGIPPQHAALELKITFKEGGAFDFSNIYERIKERLQLAVEVARESGQMVGDGSENGRGLGGDALQGVNLDSVHLDDLPTYEAASTAARSPQVPIHSPVPLRSPVSAGLPGRDPTPPRSDGGVEEEAEALIPPNTLSPRQDTFCPPSEPPPGYEEVQRDSVVDELERRLRAREGS